MDGTDIWKKTISKCLLRHQNVRSVKETASHAEGREEVKVVSHLRKRLDILLVKDDIAMLHARTQNVPNPHVDGDMDVDITRSSTIIIYKFGRTVFIPIKSLNSKHINGHKQT